MRMQDIRLHRPDHFFESATEQPHIRPLGQDRDSRKPCRDRGTTQEFESVRGLRRRCVLALARAREMKSLPSALALGRENGRGTEGVPAVQR